MEENLAKEKRIDELNILRHRIKALEQSDLQCKRMENALRESELHKRAILDASIDRIRHVDKNLRILWANKTTLALDMSPEDIIGQTCHKLFVGKDTPCKGCPNLKARETGQIEQAVIHKPHVKGIVGETYWDLYIVPLKDEAGAIKTFFQVARNITDQKQAEHSLRESEEMFRGIFTGSPIAIAIYDSDGRLLNANSAYLKIFGMADVLTIRGFNLLDEPFVPADVKKNLRSFRPVRYEFFFDFEVAKRLQAYATSRTGLIYIDVQITPLIHTDKTAFRGYLVQIQDISDRKQAETHIHNLTHDLIKAQEGERQKISRELHDRVAQDLSTLKIRFDTLFDDTSEISNKIRERVTQLGKILQSSIAGVRDLSYDLRPPGLDQLGLVRTIFQYCEDFSEKSGVRVDFYSAGVDDLRLNFDTEINLYRLIQEGLNNVKKHADANRVTIRMVASFPNIILRIEDDGKGFNVEKRWATAVNEKRMGLQSMKERVGLLNGKMRIQSRPNSGTKILVEIPYKEKNNGTQENHFNHR
ncbi:MAG: PAS domain S-box protein [Deltaproteobacteria bacterium]|nr:PAS domain S-box protein [Deltaproteobacteria bacterium]